MRVARDRLNLLQLILTYADDREAFKDLWDDPGSRRDLLDRLNLDEASLRALIFEDPAAIGAIGKNLVQDVQTEYAERLEGASTLKYPGSKLYIRDVTVGVQGDKRTLTVQFLAPTSWNITGSQVEIKLVNAANIASRTTVMAAPQAVDADGLYSATVDLAVPAGTYHLELHAKGMQDIVHLALTLT